MHWPLLEVILFLASVVNLSAHTLSPSGSWSNLLSLVTVPTTETILLLNLVCPWASAVLSWDKVFTILDNEIGYLFNLVWLSLLWMVVLNLDSVLLDKNE
jgi:hypothetical protein